MLVKRFLSWIKSAPSDQRADATAALARAYLYSQMSPNDRAAAAHALMYMLDDPCVSVREALAQALARDARAPGHLVRALINDSDAVALPLVAQSPLLSDAELIDLAASRPRRIAVAIAGRGQVSAALAAALAEIGCEMTCATLAGNRGAVFTRSTLTRMVERFGDRSLVREALLTREDLSVGLRQDLVARYARSLAAFVSERGWMSAARADAMARAACEHSALTLLSERRGEERAQAIRHLREGGQLTTPLVMRALLSGATDVLVAILMELTGFSERRVRGFVREPRGIGFGSLLKKAGLPRSAIPAIRAGLAVLARYDDLTREDGHNEAPVLFAEAVEAALFAQSAANDDPFDPLTQLLSGWAAEAARAEGRASATALLGSAQRPIAA